MEQSNSEKFFRPRVLVTGSTGFLGRRLVEILVTKGYGVRALARRLSNIERLKELGVEIYFGDVADAESLRSAYKGIDVIIHAAADTSGKREESDSVTIQGTKNIVDLCGEYSVKKLIHISSCNVYGVADFEDDYIVTEESSLERFPERRGYYTEAKLKAEEIVISAMKAGLPAVCLRPGTYFGSGGEIYTPMMGLRYGERIFAIIGNGNRFVLPLIYIDNLVEAIIACIENEKSTGRIYNVVEPHSVTKKQYVDDLLKRVYPRAKFIYVPYGIFYSLVLIQEIVTRLIRMRPLLTRYRLRSSQRPVKYSSERIVRELGWSPGYTMKEAIEVVVKSCRA